MNIAKMISTTIEQGRRIIKMRVFGKSDARTAPEAGPFGIDSNPLAGMEAIWLPGTVNGRAVCIGYINAKQLAAAGETRLYSLDSNGNLKTYIWLKGNGDIELGGNTHHATQYEALNNALQNYITALNSAISTGIASAGGSYTPPPAGLDISGAMLNHIKTP